MSGRKIFSYVNDLSVWAAYLGGAVTLFAAVITTYDVFMRCFLHNPTSWALELSQYALLFSTFIGAAYTLREDAYIRVDILIMHFPVKIQKFLHMLSGIIILVMFIYLVAMTGKYSIFCFEKGWREPTLLRTPIWIPLSIIPLGCIMVALQQCTLLVQHLGLNKK